MSTWKKYGGIDKFDKTNHMTVDSIVANYFTLRKQIIGDIDISGNLTVRDRLDVYNDASFTQDVSIDGNVDIDNNLDVSGNITTNSNLTVKDNILLYHNLYFNSDRKVFMNGTPDGIGINTTMPISQFDITSKLQSVFSVKTTQNSTENVIARNNADKGIVVKSDLSSATIDFFCDSSMISSAQATTDTSGNPQLDVQLNYNNYDARIQAKNDGSLTIDACANIQLLAKTIITDNKSSIMDNNTSLSVYNDITNNVYLEDVYDNSAAYVGDGISLVSVDESSSIFMKMVSRSNNQTSKGFALVGGTFSGDTSRAMGSLGCIDDSGNYTPNQTIVSGNSNVKLKTSLGINKYVPDVDTRVLDVNGPVRINNGEITTVKNLDFQSNFLSFDNNLRTFGIVGGSPYSSYDSSFADEIYWESKIYYTNDAGMTWNSSTAQFTGSTNAQSLNAGFVYDSSYAFVYGDAGSGFYTIDGGVSWFKKNFNGDETNIKSLYVANGVGYSDCRFFMTYDGVGLRYYDAKLGSDTNYISYDGSNGSIGYDNTSYDITNIIDISGAVNAVHGDANYLYVAGESIYKYEISSSIASDNYLAKHTPYSSSNYYNIIHAYDSSYIVAAGENIISYFRDGSWNDIIFYTDPNGSYDDITVIYSENGESFQSIHVYDSSNAIVVGTNGSIYYTNNGTLWKKAYENLLDAAGNYSVCYSSADLNGVFCVNENSFVTTRLVNDYTDITNNGSSKIFYNYFPDLFNHANNDVLDICGNMNICGDIRLQSNSNISSTGDTFYLVNDSVQNVYLGGDASNIVIGDSNGLTTFNHNVYIAKDLTVIGALNAPLTIFEEVDTKVLNVYKNATIDGSLNIGDIVVIDSSQNSSYSDSSGALVVAGGCQIGGNIIMSNNESLLYIGGENVATPSEGFGSLYVNGDTKMVGSLYAMKNVYISSYNDPQYKYALQVDYGNTYFNNDIDLCGNITVGGNIYSNNSAVLNGTTYINGNVIYGNGVNVDFSGVTIGNITLSKSVVGLGNVDNTSDVNKPISTATKAYVDASLNLKAPLASPVLTGTPTAPTAASSTSSDQIATTAFVKNQSYLTSSNVSSTYAPLASPVFTGIPTAPTASSDTSSNQIATTSFVKSAINNISLNTTSNNTWTATNTFSKNIYVDGVTVGAGNSDISSNSVLGGNAFASNTSGINNVAIGRNNLSKNTTGGSNSSLGSNALFTNTTGGANSSLGGNALYSNVDGGYNVAIGYDSGKTNTSGSRNTFLGASADSSGNYSNSTAIGYNAKVTGNNQIVAGTSTEYVYIPSTTTSGNISSGALVVSGGVGIGGNVYIGGNAYATTASSTENSTMVATTSFVKTAINSISLNTSADNTWTGYNTFSKNITVNGLVIGAGGTNTELHNYAFGSEIFGNGNILAVTGMNNVGVCNGALKKLTTGSNNSVVGYLSLEWTTTGSNNSALGANAGQYNITGSYNTFLGWGTNTNANQNYSYSTAVGQNALMTGNNQIVLGTASEYVYIPGTTNATSYNNAALVVSGGVGISGNVIVNGYVMGANAVAGNSSSSILATTAFVTNAINDAKNSFSGGSGGNSTITTSSNNAWTGKNSFTSDVSFNGAYFSSAVSSSSTSSGALIVSGGIGIGGNIYTGGNIVINSTSASTTPITGALIVSGGIGVVGNICASGNIVSNGNITINNTTDSTTSSSGALIVSGGIGVAKNAYVGGNVVSTGNITISSISDSTTSSTGALIVSGGIGVAKNAYVGGNVVSTGNITISSTSDSTGSSSGALIVSGGIGVAKNAYVGGNVVSTGNITISSTSDSTTSSSGALIVSGGIGVAKNAYVGGNVVSTGNITINNITDSTSSSTGALIVSGGIGVAKNAYVGGNVVSTGNITINNITDSTSSSTGALIVSGGIGVAKNAYVGGNVVSTGNITINNITDSTTSSSGALIVSGGIGVAKNAYVGGNVVSTGNITINNTTDSTTSSSGALIVSGGIGVAKNAYVGGNVVSAGVAKITNTTDAAGTTSGALIVSGGVGIASNLYVGSYAYATTPPTDSSNTMLATTSFVQKAISTISTSTGSTAANNTWSGTNTFSNNITVNGVLVGRNSVLNNYVFGNNTLTNISTGGSNMGIGTTALYSCTTGSYNIGIGGNVLYSCANGNSNTAMGYVSLQQTTGNYNSALGSNAGQYNSQGSYNTFLGYSTTAVTSNTSYSTAIGYNAYITGNNQIVMGTSGEYVYIPSSKAATSTTYAALVVSGGAGIGGNVYVSGNVYINNVKIINANTTNIGIGSSTTFSSITGTQNTVIGYNSGNAITSGYNNTMLGYNSGIVITSGYNNTMIGATSGNAITTGYNNTMIGYNANNSGNFNTSTAIGINANITANNQIIMGTSSEYVYIPSTRDASGSTYAALVVSGGAGISGSVYVGSTTASTSTSTGALIVKGGAGISGNVYASGNIVISSTTEASTTTAGALMVSGGISVTKSVYVGSTTASTSTITGALIVKGGAGISGNVYASGNIVISSTTEASTTTAGALMVSGGISVTKSVYVGSTTASTSTSTGALIVKGGAGIAGTVYVGGDLSVTGNISGTFTGNLSSSNVTKITNTTASTSSTSGALVVTGGVGIGGNVNVGGCMSASSLSLKTLIYNAGNTYTISSTTIQSYSFYVFNIANTKVTLNALGEAYDGCLIYIRFQDSGRNIYRGSSLTNMIPNGGMYNDDAFTSLDNLNFTFVYLHSYGGGNSNLSTGPTMMLIQNV